ncbi:acyl-CoA N-acyltransferase, partial [Jaminaea rosea]
MPPPSLPSSSSSSSLAPPSTPSSSLTSKPTPPPPTPRVPHLWICEGCFKYTRSYAAWYAHKHKECKQHHPPGRKVYQRGSHIIWEVDGAKEKLYAQNLSLFGKLFIDHKTIYFDVEPFVFYIVTDAATASFDYVLGFFSKEKVSYDDYNLACIITFPPFQKKGFGTLMIEYSYHLSLTSGIAGTPERPLSELGFKGYLSYWSAVVLRTL